MRIFLAAAIAAAALAPLPAMADEIPFFAAPGPDSYPPLEPMLRPSVQMQVDARDGRGLSLAGFYNDPSVLMRRRHPVESVYTAPASGGGPAVIYSGYGADPAVAERNAHCSEAANRRGLHGVARKDFRSECKAAHPAY